MTSTMYTALCAPYFTLQGAFPITHIYYFLRSLHPVLFLSLCLYLSHM